MKCRNIQKINVQYTDENPHIIFREEKISNEPIKESVLVSYTIQSISNVFRIMGCVNPMNTSMAEWVFLFVSQGPENCVMEIIDPEGKSVFEGDTYSAEGNYLTLNRFQFHRLITTSLYLHLYRKPRYYVDFRLALDISEQRRFCIVLLSGAPGTGKSTIASLLASKMSISHIISTDSIRHAMRTMFPKEQYPILHCSTYECGDVVDPKHMLGDDERCLLGYNEQAKMVGDHLKKVIQNFVQTRTSLIVEGVHLSAQVLMDIVQSFPNIAPFLIYIKKEDFHQQRFAVRAKYMTTDPSQNRYISNFGRIRLVQTELSTKSSEFLIPKIDNRNIDRTIETIHHTVFLYMKKLEGRPSLYDPYTKKLTFLNEIWKRRKIKLGSKNKTVKSIQSIKSSEPDNPESQADLSKLLNSLPAPGKVIMDDSGSTKMEFLNNGSMVLVTRTTEQVEQQLPKRRERVTFIQEDIIMASGNWREERDAHETDTEGDPVEVTLTDYIETTDTDRDEKHHSADEKSYCS